MISLKSFLVVFLLIFILNNTKANFEKKVNFKSYVSHMPLRPSPINGVYELFDACLLNELSNLKTGITQNVKLDGAKFNEKKDVYKASLSNLHKLKINRTPIELQNKITELLNQITNSESSKSSDDLIQNLNNIFKMDYWTKIIERKNKAIPTEVYKNLLQRKIEDSIITNLNSVCQQILTNDLLGESENKESLNSQLNTDDKIKKHVVTSLKNSFNNLLCVYYEFINTIQKTKLNDGSFVTKEEYMNFIFQEFIDTVNSIQKFSNYEAYLNGNEFDSFKERFYHLNKLFFTEFNKLTNDVTQFPKNKYLNYLVTLMKEARKSNLKKKDLNCKAIDWISINFQSLELKTPPTKAKTEEDKLNSFSLLDKLNRLKLSRLSTESIFDTLISLKNVSNNLVLEKSSSKFIKSITPNL